MKVVKPEWLTDSVSAGTLLPWSDYIFRPNERVENSQGELAKQLTINNSIASREASNPTAVGTGKAPANNGSTRSSLFPPTHAPRAAPKESLHTTDPTTEADAKRVPSYSSAVSNPNAQRVMANPEWRKAHTSIAPDFIEGYYKNSRLHYLSTWKSELRALVMEAQERAEANISSTPEAIPQPIMNGVSMRGEHLRPQTSPKKWKGKGKAKIVDRHERVIMHCDFDCFFVSAGLVSRPELKGKPVVVCHSQGAQGGESSTSEIASCSYEARDFGIRNGMRFVFDCEFDMNLFRLTDMCSLQQARKLCSSVVTIPYEFER